jgi:hypothetical protein
MTHSTCSNPHYFLVPLVYILNFVLSVTQAFLRFCMVSSVLSVCYCATLSLKYKLCWSALWSNVCGLFKVTTCIRSEEIPAQALRIPGGWGSQILDNRHIKGHSGAGKIMSLKSYGDPHRESNPRPSGLQRSVPTHSLPLPAYQAYRVEWRTGSGLEWSGKVMSSLRMPRRRVDGREVQLHWFLTFHIRYGSG